MTLLIQNEDSRGYMIEDPHRSRIIRSQRTKIQRTLSSAAEAEKATREKQRVESFMFIMMKTMMDNTSFDEQGEFLVMS